MDHLVCFLFMYVGVLESLCSCVVSRVREKAMIKVRTKVVVENFFSPHPVVVEESCDDLQSSLALLSFKKCYVNIQRQVNELGKI